MQAVPSLHPFSGVFGCNSIPIQTADFHRRKTPGKNWYLENAVFLPIMMQVFT